MSFIMQLNSEKKDEVLLSSPNGQQTPCCTLPFVQLWNEDCLETLKRLPTGSVDLMLQDPPYGVTQNEWDKEPNLAEMWAEWERVSKPNGAWIFTATQPFASSLITSRAGFFKYDIIWEKSRPTGFLNANRMPLRSHEHILIFYRELPVYNPQMTKGKPNHVKHGTLRKSKTNNNYGAVNPYAQTSTENKHPKSIIFFDQQDPNDIVHPTQKPVDLFRWVIKTYTNPGDVVFDGYSGSGTTAAACIKEKRYFIGSELNKKYYDLSVKRLTEMSMQTELF